LIFKKIKKVQQILYILHKMCNMINIKIISTLSFSGVDALRAAGKLGIVYYRSLKLNIVESGIKHHRPKPI
jgi:hypothetical protein